MVQVTLLDSAFVNIITSSIEVYKKESLGFLIGSKKKNTYIIKSSIAFQNAERKVSEVILWELDEKKVKSALNYLTGYQVVGDFHSHADEPYALSRTDKEDLKSTGDSVSLLLVVKKRKKSDQWRYNPKTRTLEGPVDDKYHILLKAYYYDHSRKKISQAKIICPFIKKLNRIIRLHFNGAA